MNISVNGTTVTTAGELLTALQHDGQGSGTRHGHVTIEGKTYWCRKHWSSSGGFPICSDESLSDHLGEIEIDGGTTYVEGRGNGTQTIYLAKGKEGVLTGVKWV